MQLRFSESPRKLQCIFTATLMSLAGTISAAHVEDLIDAKEDKLYGYHIVRGPAAITTLAAPVDELRMISSRVDRNNVTHERYRQFHMNTPVFGKQAIVHSKSDGRLRNMSGSLVKDIQYDVLSTVSDFQPADALQRAKDLYATDNPGVENLRFRNEHNEKTIFLDDTATARLGFHISFVATAANLEPARPNYILDAATLQPVKFWDGLTTQKIGTGPGGNQKVGAYEYGTDFPAMDVAVDSTQTRCTLQNQNVKTINLNHDYYGDVSMPAHEFDCPHNTVKEINGAYSPLNDAHFFGGQVFNMFKEWYNRSPLNTQLTLFVHFGDSYENAFWDGRSMTFGDGYNRFYPLVGLDVVSHEVSHGFTEQNSNLIYSEQPGGISEAFSDMAGKAAEFYSRGSNNWAIGFDVFKAPGRALRYMNDPTRDGISIAHADDYFPYMDVHFSSGVYNRAFYLLATAPGWDTQRAFDTMVYANIDYWTPSTTFDSGACGVFAAATDLGYPASDVVNAFADVGVICGAYRAVPPPVIAEVSPKRLRQRPGKEVSLSGAGFCHFQCNNLVNNTETQVTLNGKVVQLIELEKDIGEDELEFIVPTDAESGPIAITTPSGTATIAHFEVKRN